MKALVTAICLLGFAPGLIAQAPASRPLPPTPPGPSTPAPSPAASGSDLVQIVRTLGPLADNLVAAFSMDRPDSGSLVFSQPGSNLSGHIFGPVSWVSDGGRQCASFARPGTHLTGTLLTLGLKQNYTLSTWMKLPVPTGTAVIWSGFDGDLLAIKGGSFTCGKEPEIQTFCSLTPVPTGWHHVAVTADGHQMAFFLDGVLKGTVSRIVGGVLTIGKRTFDGAETAQCDCLDDMLFFDRALTANEIVTLTTFRLPVHPPSPEDIAAAARLAAATPKPSPVAANGAPAPAGVPVPQSVASPGPPLPFYGPGGVNAEAAQITNSLGPMADDLLFALSMDSPRNGSLVFLRLGIFYQPFVWGPVSWINDQGRQCASFAQPGASLTGMFHFNGRPDVYTLAGWMKLPVPSGTGVVADSLLGPLLAIKDGDFICGNDANAQSFCTLNPVPAGWHHVAISADGSQTSFYFDGVKKGTVPRAMMGLITSIGNSRIPGKACDCLDDFFFFRRALTAEEISALGAVRLPIHPPNLGFAPPNAIVGAPPSVQPIPAVSPEMNKAAAELVKTYRNSLVFVSGANGAGSGFLASYANQNLLFTNAHVAAGVRGASFKTLEGENVRTGAASVAVGEDVFLMQATSTGKPLEIMQGVDKETAIGDDVVVLGNAGGAGVINTIMGKIVGVGPNLVETDAPFIPGNSGSPIIHLKTGKVIAIATYAMIKKFDPATKQPLATPEVRRFGYRLDSVKSWQPVDWASFSNQAAELERIEALTGDLIRFVNDIAKNRKISPGLHTNPVIKTRIDVFEAGIHKRASSNDIQNTFANFTGYLKAACRSDITAAQQHFTYDYFQHKLADEQRDRTRLAELIELDVQGIQLPSTR